MFEHSRQVGRALFDGARSAVFLRPRDGAFDVTLPAGVSLCVLHMLASAALEYVLAGRGASFNPQGLIAHTTYFGALALLLSLLPFGLAGAAPARIFVAVVALSTVLMGTAAAAVLALRPLLGKVEVRLTQDAAMALSLALLPVLLALAVFVLLQALTLARLGYGLASHGRVLAAIGIVLAQLLAIVTFPYAPLVVGRDTPPIEFSLLQAVVDLVRPPPPEVEDETPRPRIDAEAVMTRQPDMMRAALATLQPPRPERAEYYFLGFAPYASQDVFKREITAVKALFDERFGTAGRSLALVNHRDSLDTLPLASMTNLNIALQKLGQIMRPDRDVLVLFVTSHGNAGNIAVEFPGFPLNRMTPERLANALDKAGIVNRVLVLSACHSGSFIERLKTDTSLILAAAHADKTSFGCSNENEWTYFGDAYFNRALRTETSLIDAFATARDLIVSWEKRDELEPSEPQIFVGAGIKAKLDAVTQDAHGR